MTARSYGLILALMLLQFAARAELSLRQESPVWDERLHAGYGLALLDRGPNFDGQDHPYPLAALLVLSSWLALPGPDTFHQARIEDPHFLRPARRMNVALATLGLLGLALWAKRQKGFQFSLVVTAIAALDPTWMACARYLTTDIGHALGWWLAAWSLHRWLQGHEKRWLLFAGAGMALGLASKWSTLALPLCALPLLWPRRRDMRLVLLTLGGMTLAASLIFLLPFAVLALSHGVSPALTLTHVGDGLAASLAKRAGERGVWLAGQWWPHGTRWYFPLLLVAKSPIALLVLVPLGLVWRRTREMLRPDANWLAMLALYLLLAIAAKQNLGHRHLTPMLPLLWWLAAAALLAIWQQTSRARLLAPVLVIALACEVLLAHPHYLPFHNRLFGSLNAQPPLVVDAAADWGQALPALRKWIKENKLTDRPLRLAYFGNADPRAFVGPATWLPCGPLGWQKPRGEAAAKAAEEQAITAVSATCVYGGAGAAAGAGANLTEQGQDWAHLRGVEPDAVLGGGSILVFGRAK